MRALSVKQPWADLIVSGLKDIENRTWKTNFRGRIYIHASQKYASVGFNSVGGLSDLLTKAQLSSVGSSIEMQLVRGRFITSAIIGEVDIIDCTQNHTSIWAQKTYSDCPNQWNWVLANPVKYPEPTLNVKGSLSFWEYEPVIK